MKWTSALLMIGGAVAIGVVSFLLHKPESKNSDTATIHSNDDNVLEAELNLGQPAQPEFDFSEQKQRNVENIFERHNEAGKVFNDTLNEIMNPSDNEIDIPTENSEKFNEIDKNLDDLMN